MRRGLEGFAGTRRRMERKGEAAGVRVYDSYAHHPAEIEGDLAAARAVAGAGRLLVVFQPHLVSRTRIFGRAMGEALGAADEVIVLDVYLAREDADPDVTGALVADAVPLPQAAVAFVADPADAPAEAVARARRGDLVLTLGAGSVTDLGPRILDLLGASA
jgi:UDP-N-acetylmuramate--alanine ligase